MLCQLVQVGNAGAHMTRCYQSEGRGGEVGGREVGGGEVGEQR